MRLCSFSRETIQNLFRQVQIQLMVLALSIDVYREPRTIQREYRSVIERIFIIEMQKDKCLQTAWRGIFLNGFLPFQKELLSSVTLVGVLRSNGRMYTHRDMAARYFFSAARRVSLPKKVRRFSGLWGGIAFQAPRSASLTLSSASAGSPSTAPAIVRQ